MSQKWRDNREFFELLATGEGSPQRLVSGYVGLHGDMNWGKQEKFLETLARAMNAELHRHQVFGADGEILPSLYTMATGSVAYPYFRAIKEDLAGGRVVMEGGPNEWFDTALPKPLNMRLGMPQRPAYEIYGLADVDLFVGPYAYQTYRPADGCYWPEASSRAFSKDVQAYPELLIGKPLVVCQDQYDCGNIAHFLYDTVPRICFFAETFPKLASTAVFVMGGERSLFHDHFLAQISRKYKLQDEQFFFPPGLMNVRHVSRLYFFSDQRQRVVHPLNIGHPRALDIVRSLLGPIEPVEGFENIYIGRSDAGIRKLVNEDEIVADLRRKGYKKICMSDFSAQDQIAFLANAKKIVAPHGMGLSYLVFNAGQGTRLTELFHPTLGSDAYALIAKAVGMDYRFMVGEPRPAGSADYSISRDELMASV